MKTMDKPELVVSQTGDSFLIPARQKHTLSIKADFKARVVMPQDSRIEFAD